ncbi:MAG: class I SAM-dependent methyltransferase [Planctomycetes bacterium]|nr:class I SAM-dependent methyltransferase [Planctomycetota bacterium]
MTSPDPVPAILERLFSEAASGAIEPPGMFRRTFEPFLARPERAHALVREARYILDTGRGALARVVDAGCGFGLHAYLYRQLGALQVEGVEMDPARVEWGRRLAAFFPAGREVSLRTGDACALPAHDGTVDLLVVRESASHVHDDEALWAEARRVLVPGGRLYIRDFNNSLDLTTRGERRDYWRRAEEVPERGYRDRRRALLSAWHPEIAADRIEDAVERTRGAYGAALKEASVRLLSGGFEPPAPAFPVRDPDTGMAHEREFHPWVLARRLRRHGFRARVLPPRLFASGLGLRGRLGAVRDAAVRWTYPLSSFVTPLFEVLAIRSP